jgi:hypothetical protein
MAPGAAEAGWRWSAPGRVHEESVAPCRGMRLLHGAYPSTLDEVREGTWGSGYEKGVRTFLCRLVG